MVDFSFIVSLYVSDLPNVTISTLVLVQSSHWYGTVLVRGMFGSRMLYGIILTHRIVHQAFSATRLDKPANTSSRARTKYVQLV